MGQGELLFKKLRNKFFSLSLIGFILLIGTSSFFLRFHDEELNRQQFFQEYKDLIRDELRSARNIGLINDQSPTTNNGQDIYQILNSIKVIQSSIDRRTKENINLFETKEGYSFRLSSYHRNVNDYLLTFTSDSEGIEQVNLNQKRLNLRSSFEKKFDALINDLNFLSNQGRIKMRYTGWALVTICLALVLLIWILVFKPLYDTALGQHSKIIEYVEEVQEVSQSRENFLMNISHEIRTPMTAILGYAELLKKNEIPIIDVPKTIGIINKNASHLLALIDELLDINKVRTDQFEYEIDSTNLFQVINEVFSLMNAKAMAKGIEFEMMALSPIPISILSDETRLKQVLMNVLGNAIKFTEKGKVSISVEESGDMIKFLITDSGPGIRKELWELIFNPFEQADASSKRKHQGTGLGLVLARELALGLGGNVTVESSELGVGSTFKVQISSGVGVEVQRSMISTNVIDDENNEKEKVSLKGSSILVVDDAKENSRLFKIYLESAGATVFVANSGAEALKVAKDKSLHLIFLDLQMPEMDGIETLRRLKADGFVKPIVALTAHGMATERNKTREAGFSRHIVKPVSSSKLSKTAYELIFSS